MENAIKAIKNGDYMTALPLYMEILELVPNDTLATAGLAKCYIHIGEIEAAKEILEQSEYQDSEDIISATKALQLVLENSSTDDELSVLQSTYASNPKDMQNGIKYAGALFAKNQQQESINVLLMLFTVDREWNNGMVKAELLKYFEVMGNENKVTIQGRKKLASLLFI